MGFLVSLGDNFTIDFYPSKKGKTQSFLINNKLQMDYFNNQTYEIIK